MSMKDNHPGGPTNDAKASFIKIKNKQDVQIVSDMTHFFLYR